MTDNVVRFECKQWESEIEALGELLRARRQKNMELRAKCARRVLERTHSLMTIELRCRGLFRNLSGEAKLELLLESTEQVLLDALTLARTRHERKAL